MQSPSPSGIRRPKHRHCLSRRTADPTPTCLTSLTRGKSEHPNPATYDSNTQVADTPCRTANTLRLKLPQISKIVGWQNHAAKVEHPLLYFFFSKIVGLESFSCLTNFSELSSGRQPIPHFDHHHPSATLRRSHTPVPATRTPPP